MEWSAEHYRLLKRDPALGPATLEELLELVHPDDRELVRSSFNRRPASASRRALIADPEDVRILQVRGEYLPREDGKPGTAARHHPGRDRGARRAGRAAARRGAAAALLRRGADRDGRSLELDGRPLRVNNALCEIFGLTRGRAAAPTTSRSSPTRMISATTCR